jgi:integrase/recombinase XerD
LPDPWPVLVNAYLAEIHLRGGSIRTPVEYGRILARFFTDYRDPSEVTPIGVHSFAYGRSPGRDLPSASTICVRLAAISSFYAFAQRLEAVGRNPAAEVRRPRATAPLRPTLGDNELRRLLAAIPNTPSGLRDRAIVVLILLDGLRRSEVLSLRAGDVDFTTGTYLVRVKGGHQRRRQIPPPALQAIVLALHAQGRAADRLVNGELLFPISGAGFYANLRRYAALASLEGVSPHVLRHAAAKLRRRSGASIEAVSAFLGHTNIATTAIYLRRHETELDDGWRDAAVALGVVPETTPAQTNSPTSEAILMSELRRSPAPKSPVELQLDGDEVLDGSTGQRHHPVEMAGQLKWVSALPGSGMPAHQYVVFGYPPPLPVQVDAGGNASS